MEDDYKLVKKMGLTNFWGYSENSVLQEFWISMLYANLPLITKHKTDSIITNTINQKGNKKKYMTSINKLVGYLRRNIGKCMDADTDTKNGHHLLHI